ncbi:U4/U6.U5 tri-snRNP-associated protein 2 [Cocos nucifera]|uniref:U4/U6.U5 tri-snRNP-associated protein 2 n=1 Tax=Cocos nucifera TaxID=13894 RepID=A0A8K0HVD4_COCNU|nr:U4/U6.U5 tri-snRNP-associated protein 2 [Cocos nucifera]
METPRKRRPGGEGEEGLVSDPKRQRLSSEEGEEERAGVDSVSNNGSLLGLADYPDDDDEEEDEEKVKARENGRTEEEREEEEDVRRPVPGKRQRQVEVRRDCPYLDTVNRQVLDFDFEKACSISLSNLNVYACLVCGKYYQGRGLNSHAYTHSLEAGHHVYINLQTEKVYCLPDGYEINDPSLDDIRHVLNPRFTREQVLHLDENRQWSRALDGSNYLPGMVGLNNIKETDFVNVTIQSLMRVSPHEFLQAVMKASNKRFQIGVQSDPVEFMSWLLNTLHAELKSKKTKRSIIHDCFQGELEVVKEIHKKVLAEKKENGDEENNAVVAEGGTVNDDVVRETSKVKFLMLGLDLPPPPLFKDAMEKNIIPQVPLFNILKKFDGETVTEVVRPCIARMRYRVTRLPKYLILHMRRFTKNNFFIEKNPTLGEGSYRVFVQRKSEELWYEMQDLHVTETLPQMVALSEAYMQIYEQQE